MKKKFLLILALWLSLVGSLWAEPNALRFNSTGDYVDLGKINPTVFSVEAWVCPNGLGLEQPIL